MLENRKKKNMKVTVIPIVIGAFGTVTKRFLKGLEDLKVGGRVETIQTTALLRAARILRRVLETVHQLSGGLRFNPKSSQTKDSKKWYLMPSCLTLSIIKVRIKGKVEQSRERSSALPYTLV